jgi:hypothetical protein
MLHVFHVVRTVRCAGEWGVVSQWWGCACGDRQTDGDDGAGCADGDKSSVEASVSGVRAGVISIVRCGIFFIRVLTFPQKFVPSDAKRLDRISSRR